MKLIDRAALPAKFREQLTRDVQQNQGCSSPPRLHRLWVEDYPYSRIFRLHYLGTQGPILVYLKTLPRWANGMAAAVRAEKLRKEYTTLLRLSAATFQSGRSTPDPIGYYPDHDVLAMGALPGQPLRHLIARHISVWNPTALLKLREPAAHVGAWLRELHALPNGDRTTFDADTLLEFCEAQFVRILSHRVHWLPADYPSKFERVAQEVASQQQTGQSATVLSHGDYKSHNIWIEDGRVQVLDFGNAGPESPLIDICSFWVELECSKWEHLNVAGALGQLQDAFLEGRSVSRRDNPLFDLVAARYFLLRLANGAETFPRLRRRKALEARVLWNCRQYMLNLVQRYA
ncbi:aminoglycoside phosphotransferase family protein [Thioalkalivibrio sp. AKL10]|uniref:aminoglycoside phosphotransferase family protein n=1 Tax=Thioalkalivibrio sp. AKL10 TaxID=1158158 RepID=UPI0003707DB0|nr:aminoglycoside phosphotransferase family protein [Thioalkalivibrio sp. AKL10]